MPHLVAVQGITERPRKLTELVQCKCLKFTYAPAALFPLMPDHRLHVCEAVLPVKDKPTDIQAVKYIYHPAVYLCRLPTQMDLTADPIIFQVDQQRRIRDNKA